MGGKQLRLWAALKLPGNRREPEEGDVETGRGKKGKKAWQLNLRLIDVICAGIGVVGLMCMSFALGALAGRGDIYRVAYSLGLLSPEAKQMAQITPQMAPAPAAPVAEAPVPVPAGTPAAAAPSPAAPPATTAASASAKSPHLAPVTGFVAPLPPPAAAASSKKKAKAAQAQHEQKAREEQLRQHQDVAKKMTFLNSFDSTPKPSQKKDKDKTKAAAAKPQPAQVKVATYRDSKTAQAKLAELQKKGVKASVKQSKDAKGACFTVYRPAPAAPAKEADKVAQSKEKTGGAARKPQAE